MKISKAIIIGIVNWIIGVSVYSLSFFLPVFTSPELQANVCLAIVLAILGWFGAGFYYKDQIQPHGLIPTLVLAAVAIILDALITVPMLIIPAGGSYIQFFGDFTFWLLIIEYLLVVLLYWRFKVKAIKMSI